MLDIHKDQVISDTRSAFPTTVRQAIHDLTQPIQALRMMLGLPGVVMDDNRNLPHKVEVAFEELDMQLNQLHTLARVLDGSGLPPAERRPFIEVLQGAQNLSPELWVSDKHPQNVGLRIYGRDCPMCLPTRNAAWVLNVLLDQAWRARPKSRIVVGPRLYGRWVIVVDDGDGLSKEAASQLEKALNGENQTLLTSGLVLARLLVAGWGGQWKVIAQPGKGAAFAFSVPDKCEQKCA